MTGLSPRLRRTRRKAGRKHGYQRVPTALHASAQYRPRALVWHLQTDQSLADSWSVSPRRGFSHPCAEAWQPRGRSHPCRHTMAPGPARERLSQTRQEDLGQPPAPQAWTKTSFLYYFLFPSLVQRAAGSFPPSLLDPNPGVSWPQSTVVVLGSAPLTCPFLPSYSFHFQIRRVHTGYFLLIFQHAKISEF